MKFWDGRTPNAVHTAQLPERVFSMDVKSPLAVLALAERHIVVYDLRKPTIEYKVISVLKYVLY